MPCWRDCSALTAFEDLTKDEGPTTQLASSVTRSGRSWLVEPLSPRELEILILSGRPDVLCGVGSIATRSALDLRVGLAAVIPYLAALLLALFALLDPLSATASLLFVPMAYHHPTRAAGLAHLSGGRAPLRVGRPTWQARASWPVWAGREALTVNCMSMNYGVCVL